jgi:integrase
MARGPNHRPFIPTPTVAELAGWLDVVARHRLRRSSFGKYEDRVRRITATLGPLPVRAVTRERVATWQSDLLKSGLAPKTVADVRVTLRQVLEQAVINGLIASYPVDRVAAPKVVRSAKRALDSEEARRLVRAALTDRLGGAVALLFVHGWRVAEALGLAWEDLDLDAGTASVRRAAAYVDGVGVMLGATKTAGATGLHHLSPGVIAALRRRRNEQAADRLSSESWQSHRYDGRAESLDAAKSTSPPAGPGAPSSCSSSTDCVADRARPNPDPTRPTHRPTRPTHRRGHPSPTARWIQAQTRPFGVSPSVGSCGTHQGSR